MLNKAINRSLQLEKQPVNLQSKIPDVDDIKLHPNIIYYDLDTLQPVTIVAVVIATISGSSWDSRVSPAEVTFTCPLLTCLGSD